MRKRYLDNIRFITVIIVVCYHVIYMYNGVAAEGVVGPFTENGIEYQDAFQYVVYPWFMALLFIISGISARLSLNGKTSKEFLSDRTRRLLVPSTIGVFAFGWIQGYISMQISGAFEFMPVEMMPKAVVWLIMSVSGIGVLWFIQMLWIFSLLTVFIRNFEIRYAKKNNVDSGRMYHPGEKMNIIGLMSIGIIVWLAAQVLNTPVIVVYRFGIYGVCYLFGYFVFCNDYVIDVLEKNALWLGIGAIALAVMEVYAYFGQNFAIAPIVNSPLSIAFAWITCLALLGMGKRYLDFSNTFTSWINKRSFGLYVFHYLPLSAFAYFGNSSGLFQKFPVPAVYLVTALIAFAGGIFLFEMISRIPVLRWMLLGIGKETKHVQGQSL